MAAFTPGAHKVRTDYNFVSAYDLHKPDVDENLTYPFGDELLTSLLKMVGNKKATSSLEYIHHEADRIMPKIKATAPGGGAGAAVTFTIPAAGKLTYNQNNSPYDTSTSSNINGNPARVNDLILIKPASGIVSASTYVRAIVTSVNYSAGTFSATPIDSTDSIPAISTADEVVIYGNGHGEGSAQPLGRATTTSKYTNNLQIIKETYEITGSEKSVVLWTKVKDASGKTGYVYSLKGEGDTYKQFMNQKELTMLLGEKLSNTTLSNTYAGSSTPLRLTEGLIPFILSQGITQNYSGVTGLTLSDMEKLALELDKQKGSKNNLFLAGMNLSMQVDRELGDRFKDGAFSYGGVTFDQSKKVALEFDSFSVGNYKFNKKTYDAMNDLQTLGASGFGFNNEGMIIPMDNQVDGKSRESVPSLRYRYLVNPDSGESREMIVKPVYLLEVGDSGTDKFEVRYISECGFEGFAGNRFAYIKQA